jgi:glutathione synthase/RimK-type ligase-like ATP-grasp enzyme
LQAIFEANRLGLSTPETAIVSTRAELAAFLEKHDRVITKGILRNSFGKFLKFNIGCLTKLVTQTELNNVTETFGLSLIQQYIEKYCELRIFYLDGIFYPCAIFSQSDENTKIDFRQYDSANPIRIVRFTLPEGIQSALILLMQRLNLSSGSIDMILTSQNEYYFLEVNPIGQFGFISHKCLYNLESKIAEYLT